MSLTSACWRCLVANILAELEPGRVLMTENGDRSWGEANRGRWTSRIKWLTSLFCLHNHQGEKDATMLNFGFFLFDGVLSCSIDWLLTHSPFALASSMVGIMGIQLLLYLQCSHYCSFYAEHTCLGLECVHLSRLSRETLEGERIFLSSPFGYGSRWRKTSFSFELDSLNQITERNEMENSTVLGVLLPRLSLMVSRNLVSD